ncbi:MAG: hypothetical protein ABFS17_13005 [Chloroflexota bacterium]
MSLINQKIERAFSLTQDLAAHLDEVHLELDLLDIPSNKIGEQLWCMIGARESYLKAIKNEKWMSFSCSLKDSISKSAMLAALTQSQQATIEFITSTTLSDTQTNFLLDLLEHEIQHHGQLIRYIYGNKLDFPKSWNERYTV